jgi:pimeloyl-ACP methyl ester carboxylesterase
MQRHAGISYLKCGHGPNSFILLHGIGSNALSFKPLIDAFGNTGCLVAWNAPGYGDSDALPSPSPDADDYADALTRLLDDIGIGRCVVIGQSLGAIIAARFAACRADRIASLVLISAAHGSGIARGSPLPARVAARIQDLDRLGPDEFARLRAPALVGNPNSRPDIVSAVQDAMSAVRRPSYDQACHLLATGDLLADLRLVRAPTLVIVGLEDRITPPEGARQAYQALSHTDNRHRYEEIAFAGHAVCQEAPDRVAQLILEFACASPQQTD